MHLKMSTEVKITQVTVITAEIRIQGYSLSYLRLEQGRCLSARSQNSSQISINYLPCSEVILSVIDL